MCNGYWYECDCKECQEAKSLYEEYEWHKDNKEEQEYIAKKLESIGYSI